MADLQSCYFCAAPDDVGEYAVVPPRLGGGDRSVALCPDCKTKLLRVMEPLIERAEAGADAGSGSEESGENDGSTESSTNTPSSSTPDEGGITMSPGAAGSSGDESAPTPGSDAASTPGSDESGSAPGDAIDPAGAGGDGSAADEKPPQYRRAMRMLSNRPFPMERSAVESMLANAYDLEREEIDAVLERAEAEGRLVAENGELREP